MEKENQAPAVRKMTVEEAVKQFKSFQLKFGPIVVNGHTDIYNAIKGYEVEIPTVY